VATFCRTTLNYASGGPTPEPAPTEVTILDARDAGLPGWRDCGFELVEHRSALDDWEDDDRVAAVHHPEAEELARTLTGCDHALVSGHIRRGPAEAARHEDLAPITFVHSDFAADYIDLIRRAYAGGEDGPDAALARHGLGPTAVADARRVVILQFWRNLGPPRMDFPLGFCDARTVTPDDVRPIPVSDYAGSGVDFEALAVFGPRERDQYRWYAFPDLRFGEVVAFRTYDTELVHRRATWFTPHSAFRDPTVEIGKPARSSIELRAICLYG
jgi:hypothetical protein